MKKIKSRRLVLALIMAMAVIGLAGCKKKTKCWNCEEMKYCEPFNDYTLGELNLCEDCRKLIEPMSNRFQEFFEGTGQ